MVLYMYIHGVASCTYFNMASWAVVERTKICRSTREEVREWNVKLVHTSTYKSVFNVNEGQLTEAFKKSQPSKSLVFRSATILASSILLLRRKSQNRTSITSKMKATPPNTLPTINGTWLEAKLETGAGDTGCTYVIDGWLIAEVDGESSLAGSSKMDVLTQLEIRKQS
jgi:hypothetical protein